jgi:Leucine-rich repeat (LRR) protein
MVLWLFSCLSFGQRLSDLDLQNQTLFTSFDKANRAPADSVYRLSLKRKLPNDFEEQILKYPHLQELHLKGMRLKKAPDVVWSLTNLTILDMSNNRLESISYKIGKLIYLEKLILNRNYILSLPVEMTQLTQLSYLDLWSNLIIEFPKEIAALRTSLKTVDMRVITINDEYREQLQLLLPETKFIFSNSCNCKSK